MGLLKEKEKEVILGVWERNKNKTHAAKELGISRITLIKKLKEYGVIPVGRNLE